MLHNKKAGSEEFSTAVHLLIGTMLFVIIAVFTMYFFTGEDIKVKFEEGGLDAEKIATRLIFSENCLALNETYDFKTANNKSWYLSGTGGVNHLVRAGIVDYNKFKVSRIKKCVPYNNTNNYKYVIHLTNFDTISVSKTISGGNGATSCADNETRFSTNKMYPVIVYQNGKKYNGRIDMNITFCYKEK